MKKISKKFLVIVLMLLTAGSIAFGGITTSQNLKLTHQIEELREEKTSIQTELDTCRSENQQYVIDIEGYTVKIEELEKDKASLEKEVTSLKGQVSELKKK